MNSQGVKLEYAGKEKAILVGIYNRTVTKEKAEEYLEEMQLLAQTAGAVTLKVYLQKMDKVHSGTYVGKGKLEEIKAAMGEGQALNVTYEVKEDAENQKGHAQHRPRRKWNSLNYNIFCQD